MKRHSLVIFRSFAVLGILLVMFCFGGGAILQLVRNTWKTVSIHPQSQKPGSQEVPVQRESSLKHGEKNSFVSSRLEEPLPFVPDSPNASGAWVAGKVEGRNVWLDSKNGLIWGPAAPKKWRSTRQENLHEIRDWCDRQLPLHAWSVPTLLEVSLSQVQGLYREVPQFSSTTQPWFTVVVLKILGDPSLVLSSFKLKKSGVNKPPKARLQYSLACVGRSKIAPKHGYIEDKNKFMIKQF